MTLPSFYVITNQMRVPHLLVVISVQFLVCNEMFSICLSTCVVVQAQMLFLISDPKEAQTPVQTQDNTGPALTSCIIIYERKQIIKKYG